MNHQPPAKNKLALHWRILIGLVAGVVVGLAVNQFWTPQVWSSMGVGDASAFLHGTDSDANTDAGFMAGAAAFVRHLIEFIGDAFMNGLKFIAVPIVLFSLAAGVASLNDTTKLGRIGGKTIGIYLATTAVAISLGLLAANFIGPGRGFPEGVRTEIAQTQAANAEAKIGNAETQRARSTWDILLDLVPSNPFASMAQGKTLQVVVVGLLMGIALTLMPREQAQPVIQLCESMTMVVIKIVEMVLLLAPFAVFALIVKTVSDLGIDVLVALIKYSLTVIGTLAIMMFVVYPLVLRLFTKVGYRRFFRAISPAQLLAFSSSSSGATMPVTMDCVERRLGVSEDVTSFVIPIGATINMDGTALYQGVAAVFIAQMFGVDLSLVDQLTIVLTATLASIGTAAVPGVGIVMLIIVLNSVNMPAEVMTVGIAVILGVDRILDMCRTACNVTGDCMVAAVIASSENEMLTEAEVDQRSRLPLDEFTKEQEEREQALS